MSSQDDLKALFSIKEAVLKPTNVTVCGIGDFGPAGQTLPDDSGIPVPIPEVADRTPLKTPVSGYDFNKGINYSELFKSYLTTGFQATNFGLAVEQIEQMVNFSVRTFHNKTELI